MPPGISQRSPEEQKTIEEHTLFLLFWLRDQLDPTPRESHTTQRPRIAAACQGSILKRGGGYARQRNWFMTSSLKL